MIHYLAEDLVTGGVCYGMICIIDSATEEAVHVIGARQDKEQKSNILGL